LKPLLFVLAVSLIGGCAAPPRPTLNISAPFDIAAAERMLQEGPNTVKGNGFMRQQGGGVVTCAGQTVNLVPATAYATERVRALYDSTERGVNRGARNYTFVPDHPDYFKYVLSTRCDAQGNFVFERVADGEFYLNTLVYWRVGSSEQGGQLMQRVSVRGGQSVSVVLAP
jgi:hypothetical protein